jgi:hypothetical protein
MDCLSATTLDDYLDGRLADGEAAAVQAHAAGCAACQGRLARELGLRESLSRLPAPEPDMRVFEQAMARAAGAEAARWRRRSAGWALAASVVLVVALSAYLPGRAPSEADIPGLSIALHEVREVSLAVESPRRLDDATFKVVLPEGIELAGYPGRREVSWTGSLESGRNLLVLPLRAEAGRGGDVVTSISQLDRTKTFVINMSVTPDARSSATEQTAIRAAT